jgi:hypothetical protein
MSERSEEYDKALEECSINAIADLLFDVQTGHCSCRAAARIIYTAFKDERIQAIIEDRKAR